MSCTLIDIGCHLQSAAWEWWAEVGLLNKVLIVGGIVAFVLGCSWSLLKLVKRIGGWPAVAGVALAVVGVVLALLPKAPEDRPEAAAAPAPGKPKGPFRFGVERRRAKPGQRTRTIFDMLRRKET